MRLPCCLCLNPNPFFSFSMRFVSYQRNVGENSSQNFLYQNRKSRIKMLWSWVSLRFVISHNNETTLLVQGPAWNCSDWVRDNLHSWLTPVLTGLKGNIPVNSRACFTLTDFWATQYSLHIVLCCVGSLFEGVQCPRQNEKKNTDEGPWD
jgi:hypothetical protein